MDEALKACRRLHVFARDNVVFATQVLIQTNDGVLSFPTVAEEGSEP